MKGKRGGGGRAGGPEAAAAAAPGPARGCPGAALPPRPAGDPKFPPSPPAPPRRLPTNFVLAAGVRVPGAGGGLGAPRAAGMGAPGTGAGRRGTPRGRPRGAPAGDLLKRSPAGGVPTACRQPLQLSSPSSSPVCLRLLAVIFLIGRSCGV